MLVINDALPARNVAELVKYAKERPGVLNYASAGVGTPAHLAGYSPGIGVAAPFWAVGDFIWR